jgi:hypothetical protein
MTKIHSIIGFLILSLSIGNAQQSIGNAERAKEIREVTFYGVDYSLTRFIEKAPADKIYNALRSINYLIIEDPDKFNVEKYFDKKVKKDFSVVKQKIDKINQDSLIFDIDDLDYKITTDQITELIKDLNLKENSGTGLIFVGELMTKIKPAKGYFYVVFFEHATRNIIFMKHVSGEANGFGLRNYWASPVYEIMKKWKYKP